MPRNLRILKKLSKKAAPLLAQIGHHREHTFPAERGENYTKFIIPERKHWERSPCHPSFEGFGRDRLFRTRKGKPMVMRSPSHVRKGTIMVGGMSGYYEPEWDEETAWEMLVGSVLDHFTDYGDIDKPRLTRRLRTPAEILRGANEMIRSR